MFMINLDMTKPNQLDLVGSRGSLNILKTASHKGDGLIRTTWYHYFLNQLQMILGAAGVQNHCLKAYNITIETAQTTLRKLEDLMVRL